MPEMDHIMDTKCTKEEEGGEDPFVGMEEFESLFIIKKWQSHRSTKSNGVEPLAHTEGDLNEIGILFDQ